MSERESEECCPEKAMSVEVSCEVVERINVPARARSVEEKERIVSRGQDVVKTSV